MDDDIWLVIDEQYARRLFIHALYLDEGRPILQTRRIGEMLDWCNERGYTRLSVVGRDYEIIIQPRPKPPE